MFALNGPGRRGHGRIPLEKIDAIVSARLGPGWVPGNAQPAAISRQVAMYMASQVGGWSTTQIGKFYNGRDHSTVRYAIARIRTLRQVDEGIDGIVTVLAEEIGAFAESIGCGRFLKALAQPNAAALSLDNAFLDAVAERIASRILPRPTCLIPATAAAEESHPSPVDMRVKPLA